MPRHRFFPYAAAAFAQTSTVDSQSVTISPRVSIKGQSESSSLNSVATSKQIKFTTAEPNIEILDQHEINIDLMLRSNSVVSAPHLILLDSLSVPNILIFPELQLITPFEYPNQMVQFGLHALSFLATPESTSIIPEFNPNFIFDLSAFISRPLGTNFQVSAVSNTHRVRLRQPDQILGFEIVPPVSDKGYLLPVTSQMLPELIFAQTPNASSPYSPVEVANGALGQARALQFVANIHRERADYSSALDHYQQALQQYQSINDTDNSTIVLNSLGAVHQEQGEYEQALEFYRQAQKLSQEMQDSAGEARTLNNIASIISQQGDYSQAINLYEQAKVRFLDAEQPKSTASVLGNIGITYSELGDYDSALQFHNQSLAIFEQLVPYLGNEMIAKEISKNLTNIGFIYSKLEDFPQALEYYQKALSVASASNDRQGEANLLNNIGFLYKDMGELDQSLKFLQESLQKHKQFGSRLGEAATLDSIGSVYREQQDYRQALDFYDQSLALYQASGDLTEEATILSNIAQTLQLQERPELAIAFFKEAVNRHEAIRQKNITLSKTLQKTYIKTVDDTYRQLADLLLSQKRLLEAQQVLELLKLEELREFTQNTRAVWSREGLVANAAEQNVIDAHGSLLAFAEILYECEKSNCSELDDLWQQREALERDYDQKIERLEFSLRQSRISDPLFQDPDSLADRAADIVEAESGTLLLYPLVLEDKLWILWTAGGGVAGTIEVPVDRKTLGQTVVQLRTSINAPYDRNAITELQTTSEKLYDWLIKPLERELEANNIESLVFAQDRITRYIPMAVLHDGESYLVEKYRLSSILSAELTDTEDRLPNVSDTAVLGLGLSESVSGFSPLPNVPMELDVIVQSADSDPQGIYPGQVYLDRAFDRNVLWQNVAGQDILHIATHAQFVPNQPEASYLMLGTGEKLSIADVEANGRRLRDVHLVVLSACETALGGATDDGIEIAGIASYFLEANRAKAVMASLWQVNDNSTSLFMQAFYEALASNLTKAEALRQAQLAMIHVSAGESSGSSSTARSLLRTQLGSSITQEKVFSHPYYWAPFILIGNGL